MPSKDVLRGHFTSSERVVHDLLVDGASEDLILHRLKRLTAELEMESFINKQDFRGRTLFVNAIRGRYPKVVNLLLVNY